MFFFFFEFNLKNIILYYILQCNGFKIEEILIFLYLQINILFFLLIIFNFIIFILINMFFF